MGCYDKGHYGQATHPLSLRQVVLDGKIQELKCKVETRPTSWLDLLACSLACGADMGLKGGGCW